MPIQTNTLAWWDVKLPGWRCAQCDQPLADSPHVCPIDRVADEAAVCRYLRKEA